MKLISMSLINEKARKGLIEDKSYSTMYNILRSSY